MNIKMTELSICGEEKTRQQIKEIQEENAALLNLLADIRKAVGDPDAKLMQDELIDRCKNLYDSIEYTEDLVNQSCQMNDGSLDSSALSSNADAMRFLAELGKIKIEHDCGRRVIGRWIN